MSAAATRHRCGMPGRTPAPSGTRSCSPWSPARTGAGATSTRTMSEAAADQRTSTPLAETPDIYGAYPRLSDDQIAALEAGGARRAAVLVIRGDDLNKTMSRYLVDQINRHPRVTVRSCTEIRQVHGNGALSAVVTEDKRTGERHSIQTRALFVFIGADPNTSWLAGAIELDDRGFVPTGPAALYSDADGAPRTTQRQPMMLETSQPGVFAAGDAGERPLTPVG